MSYSVDTSALLNAWWRNYPPKVFESVWEGIDALIKGGRFLAPDEVLRELAKQDDELHNWVRERSVMFVPLAPALQKRAKSVIDKFPSLVNTKAVMGGAADPFVIALALERKLIVVTEEKPRPKRPRIPDVCNGIGITWMPLVQVFIREGWRI